MSISKKHFVALAQGLRFIRPAPDPDDLLTTAKQKIRHDMWKDCCENVAYTLGGFNPAFSRQTFLEACGYYDPFIPQEDEL
jgi:hypothetical protein